MPGPRCCICGTSTSSFRPSRSYEKYFSDVFGQSVVGREGVICRVCRGKCIRFSKRGKGTTPEAKSELELDENSVDSRLGLVGARKRRYGHVDQAALLPPTGTAVFADKNFQLHLSVS